MFVRHALAPSLLTALPRLVNQSLDFEEQSSVRNQLYQVEAHFTCRQRQVGTGFASDLKHFQIFVDHDPGWAVLRKQYAIHLLPPIDAAPESRS